MLTPSGVCDLDGNRERSKGRLKPTTRPSISMTREHLLDELGAGDQADGRGPVRI